MFAVSVHGYCQDVPPTIHYIHGDKSCMGFNDKGFEVQLPYVDYMSDAKNKLKDQEIF